MAGVQQADFPENPTASREPSAAHTLSQWNLVPIVVTPEWILCGVRLILSLLAASGDGVRALEQVDVG